jgi:glycosyltransferase involved in cell wall biosynthesis
MKKKLLILIDTMKPMVDGVSMFLDNTLEGLSKYYDITIIAPHYSDGTYDNARLITFPLRRISRIDYGIPKIKRKIIKEEVKKCDLIFNHESLSPANISFYALRYANKFNKPFFTYIHSIDFELITEIFNLPGFFKGLERFFLKRYAQWFLNRETRTMVSFPTIEKILREINVKEQYEIVPIGISDIFKPGPSKYSDSEKIVIGYVGRISREKGLDVLLEIFFKLQQKYNNLKLLIVGDGPLRKSFENKKNVTLTGFVNQTEVAEYYRAMDIFVLPSITEANSLSTLEALKSGVCCVNTDVGAIRDYLKNGFNGFFYEGKSGLKEILDKLIKDDKLRKDMGKNAAKSVTELTWDNTVNCLIKVFEK